jgi:error-prone DNA polymerase
MLASTGALNSLPAGSKSDSHRRDALWEAERQFRLEEPLLEPVKGESDDSPLSMMNEQERISADYGGTGLTVGRHPMALLRTDLQQQGITSSAQLKTARHGSRTKAAGMVIVRQRPGTAKGFVFLSLEDETGIANIIVTPDLFDRYRMELVNEPYLVVDGVVQNTDNVISLKAEHLHALRLFEPALSSHDFH